MNLEQALSTLRKAEIDLRQKGVSHAAIFGSTARGDGNAQSDLDVLIDFDPSVAVTIYDYVAVQNDIASLFDGKVMAGAGNVYRHGYDNVAPRRIWETVRIALPPLRVSIDQELSRIK